MKIFRRKPNFNKEQLIAWAVLIVYVFLTALTVAMICQVPA